MPTFPRRSVEQHTDHIDRLLEPVLEALRSEAGAEAVPVDEALGRVTAARVDSPVDLPLFRNAQMDGFAVRAADVSETPVTLPVAGEIAARALAPDPLAPGTAVRIMTGGVVPDGADAVVPVEDTTPGADSGGHGSADGYRETVVVGRPRTAGEYVRERGSDVHAGDELLPSGVRLASRHLAVLAAAGITQVSVRRRLRVAVLTTGAELVVPGSEPSLGQVFDSNGTALAAAVVAAGGDVVARERATDDIVAFGRTLDAVLGAADVVVTSGGISMGDYEVVRETLEPLGAEVGSVSMQPGGPQATAVVEGVPILSFPGNPVSTQLSFEVFLAPLLRRAAGLPGRTTSRLPLAEPLRSVPGKRQFLRGRFEGDGVRLVSGPGSHLVAGLAAADCLVVVPEDVLELGAGDTVEVWAL